MGSSFRIIVLLVALASAQAATQPGGVAYLAVDLQTGRTIASVRRDLIDEPVAPGSIAKIATLAAALEHGVITERTGILCTGTTRVAGQTLTCAHPDFHRPLRPAEALAHSCNVFFATIAARLSRTWLDAAPRSLALPPSDAGRPIAGAALGIDGLRTTPRQLVTMIGRVARNPTLLPWKPDTLRIVREGLRNAARHGTAAALGDRGIDALAKTGTTVSAAGVAQGLVVGATPSSRPATGFVLLAAGVAGMDAASLAAERLLPARAHREAGRKPEGFRLPVEAPQPSLRIGRARNGGYTVVTMPIEEYVAGIVAGEGAYDAEPAAHQALAITARTFALANRDRHAAEGFDLCDLTHCQVLRTATKAARGAAEATAGRILLRNGAPAPVYYSASCGGYTERPGAVWPGAPDPAFLPSKPDLMHADEPPWVSHLQASDLVRALRAGGFRGDTLRNLSIAERQPSGRVAWLRIDGFTPARISGNDLRTLIGRTLGWQHLKSTMFDASRTGSGYQFRGRGAGHGVGLCIVGSSRLAKGGESAEAILATYFPGLRVGTLPSGPQRPRAADASATALRIVLPEADQDEYASVRRMTTDAAGGLSSELGLTNPGRLTLRFHPSVESYTRATGQPWFTSTATIADSGTGSESHFLPVRVLRRRGLLETTVRHELVHGLTGRTYAGRPMWVAEGAAAWFAEPRRHADAGTASTETGSGRTCPEDHEFRRPVSADTLARAYERARACFAAELRVKHDWRVVGASEPGAAPSGSR